MSEKTKTLRGKFTVYWFEYPTGQNSRFGAGGWSRGARSRPMPKLVKMQPSKVEVRGKSVFFDGIRKLKATIIRNSNGEVMREDYDLARIKEVEK
jgi:hypothetical protein